MSNHVQFPGNRNHDSGNANALLFQWKENTQKKCFSTLLMCKMFHFVLNIYNTVIIFIDCEKKKLKKMLKTQF